MAFFSRLFFFFFFTHSFVDGLIYDLRLSFDGNSSDLSSTAHSINERNRRRFLKDKCFLKKSHPNPFDAFESHVFGRPGGSQKEHLIDLRAEFYRAERDYSINLLKEDIRRL